MKVENAGTERLFNNPILERLTRSHISVPVSLFGLYAVALLFWSAANTALSIGLTVGLFFLGWVVYSWIEYLVHRFLFHIPTTTEARTKFQYTMHGVHHHHPKDKDRIAMPPLLSITVATVLLIVFRFILGDYAFSFTAGFLVGYGSYLLVHYLVHIHQPPKNMFRQLWINHSIHHYRDGEIIFGVSSPMWDYIYGTMERRTQKAPGQNVES
ncbi:MAG TPA: sterol desaturase family protein [Cyclobacteriaceae bacterium]|nr:sterol desaturase family protein [Cyclobacteriaceae bacterium]